MDQSAGRSRMRHRLAGVALGFLLCGTNAGAQTYGPPPTIGEAHEFLASTFQRYAIGYVVWHGGGTRDNHKGRVDFYGGRDCYSELGTGRSGRAFAVDWSLISAVAMSGVEGIYVTGQLVRTSQNPGAWPQANFHLYFPDAGVARSVSNAFEILRRSCLRRSRFD
jgi:hypothetical protein